jgi:hypothetical protein
MHSIQSEKGVRDNRTPGGNERMNKARTILMGLVFMVILVPVVHACAGASAGPAHVTFVVV